MSELLTTKEVASILRVHVYTITRWLRNGQLPAVRIGHQWRVKREDIEKYSGGNHDRQER